MRLRWSRAALKDLMALRDFIAQERPETAAMIAKRILDATAHLEQFPEMGRLGRVAGTRELIINKTPYIATYRTRHNTIELLRVLHHARRWPKRL